MFNTKMFDNSPTSQTMEGIQPPAPQTQPQPIDINMSSRQSIFQQPSRIRRESLAHSQGMGGVSWGSVTIGSWLKDEVMMQQPSHHRRESFRHPHNQMSTSPPGMASYLPDLESEYCKDYSCCGELLPTLHDLLRHYEEAHISPSPPPEPPHAMLDSSRHARNNLNIMHNIMETVSTTDVFLNTHNNYQFGGAMNPMHHQQLQPPPPQSVAPNQFAPQQFPPHPHQQPPPPQPQPPQQRAQPRQGSPMDEDDNTMYIDDPARHLYMENDEHKPFKCPVIGCEKTYKNQNGLKYHRLHGHQGQTLKENPDGTISIIDPESNTPYLDGAGMEKDKPYRCEVCGKRYKNLNGLKYHRGHTTH